MPRPTPRTKPSQADTLRRGLEAIRLLREKPRRTEELAAELGIEQRSAERLLAAIREAGLDLVTEVRNQRHRYYSLPAKTLARVLP
jgi:DNA-binding IclR family transcriptional regulator